MKIGLQLYSVRDEAEKDLYGVLQAVAQTGYRGVEFAGFFGNDLRELRRHLETLGLVAVGTHTQFDEVDQDIEHVIAQHHTLGASYCTIPYFKAPSAAAWREFAERLNAWGQQFNKAGIRLSYHNHDFEFETIGDTTPYTILRQVCEPALVGLELDVAWAQKRGQDPAALIESLGAQCPLIHLKDVSRAGADADIGTGMVDVAAVLKAAERVGVVWGIVERDTAPSPTLQSAQLNFEALRELVQGRR
jgi:sugar phosphate isomerase/epimerase